METIHTSCARPADRTGAVRTECVRASAHRHVRTCAGTRPGSCFATDVGVTRVFKQGRLQSSRAKGCVGSCRPAGRAIATSLADPFLDFDVNARGTLNLLESLRAMGPTPSLLFTSTNKGHGDPCDVPLRRRARYEPVDDRVLERGIDESRRLDFHSAPPPRDANGVRDGGCARARVRERGGAGARGGLVKSRPRVAFFGSSLVSAHHNGAAAYYRGIVRALDVRGFDVTFYEPDAYDRQAHRDPPDPDRARVAYSTQNTDDVLRALDDARDADVVVKASGVGVFDE